MLPELLLPETDGSKLGGVLPDVKAAIAAGPENDDELVLLLEGRSGTRRRSRRGRLVRGGERSLRFGNMRLRLRQPGGASDGSPADDGGAIAARCGFSALDGVVWFDRPHQPATRKSRRTRGRRPRFPAGPSAVELRFSHVAAAPSDARCAFRIVSRDPLGTGTLAHREPASTHSHRRGLPQTAAVRAPIRIRTESYL